MRSATFPCLEKWLFGARLLILTRTLLYASKLQLRME